MRTRVEKRSVLGWNKSKVPASLSSISLPRTPSPETTYYIIPRVQINGRYFINAMCYSNPYPELAQKARDMDKACNFYFVVTGK